MSLWAEQESASHFECSHFQPVATPTHVPSHHHRNSSKTVSTCGLIPVLSSPLSSTLRGKRGSWVRCTPLFLDNTLEVSQNRILTPLLHLLGCIIACSHPHHSILARRSLFRWLCTFFSRSRFSLAIFFLHMCKPGSEYSTQLFQAK
jgi:hypothetical protein